MIEDYVVDGAATAPSEFPWGRLIWLVNQERAADAEMTVGICEIEPGASNPEHFHPNCEEVLFVLEGECEHTLGDEVVRLTPGMMIRCPAHLPHHAVNTGSVPLRALICYSSPDRRTEHVD